jgi:hypothetical protein
MRTHCQQHSSHSRPKDVFFSERARPPTTRSTHDLWCPNRRIEDGEQDYSKSRRNHDAYDKSEYEEYEVPYTFVRSSIEW